MSTAAYKRNESQLHIFTCKWTYKGHTQAYNFKYTGDVIEGYFACRNTVIWAKHPSFRITNLQSKKA